MTTPLPIPPSSSRPQSFPAECDTFLGALPTFQAEMNALGAQAEADAAAAEAAKNAAVPAAATATEKAAQAEASALSALNSPGTTATSTTSMAIPTSLPAAVSLTIQTGKALVVGQYLRAAASASPANFVEGEIASYNSATGALVLTARQAQGVGTYAAWTVSVAAPRLTTVNNSITTKASAFTANVGDIGRMFKCSGAWTLSLDPAAALGDGWYVYVKNTGAGTITVDPNAAELIQSAASIQILPGDTFLIACDGVAFDAERLSGRQTIYLNSGTSWTPPYDCNAEISVTGGGQGGDSTNGGMAAGGYSGATAIKNAQLKRSVTYTTAIGAAGAGAPAGLATGSAGGTSSFSGPGIAISAPGGNAASGSVSATGGDINMKTQPGLATPAGYGGQPGALSFYRTAGSGGQGGVAPSAGGAGAPGQIRIEF